MADAVSRALEVARWAPSAHNTQPWRVERAGASLVVRADESRWLSHTDAQRRDLRLSLGGFTEALRLGLLAAGERFDLVEPGPAAFARLERRASVAPDKAGATWVRVRQTSRLRYSPRALETAALEALTACGVRERLQLHLVTRGSSEHQDWQQWFFLASRESWLDVRAVDELRHWVRLDPEGLRRPEDGLSTHCLGLGPAETGGFALALRPLLWRALSWAWVAAAAAERLATAEAAAVGGTQTLGVLVAEDEGALSGPGLMRFWLEATRLGLALHPLSVLLDRRGWEVAKRLGVSPRHLAMAFRLGHSAPPPRSGRIAVSRFAPALC